MKKLTLLGLVLLLSGCIFFESNNPRIIGQVDYALPQLEIVNSLNKLSVHNLKSTFASQLTPTEILIKPYSYTEELADQLLQDLNAEYYQVYPLVEMIVLGKTTNTSIEDFLKIALDHPLIEIAEINYPLELMTISNHPNDSKYLAGDQWNYEAIYLPYAWAVTTGDKAVKIAVLDTGIVQKHPDLSANLIFDYDNAEPRDHGTHVAGIIGANTNNHFGIAGTNWDVEIISIPIIHRNDSGSLSDLVNAIEIAIELEVDIINISAGINLSTGNSTIKSLMKSIQKAHGAGITIVASAGNERVLTYPAAYPEVIAVGATNVYHEITGYSAHKGVTLFAPGGGEFSRGIISTTGTSFKELAGTSMAAPHVTGVIGLIKAINPKITPSDVHDLLWETGMIINPANPDQRIINAYAAVTEASLADVSLKLIHLTGTQPYHAIRIREPYRTFSVTIKPGFYLLTAHLDVDHNQELNQGDWYFEQEILVTEDDKIIDLGMIRLQLQTDQPSS